MGPVIPLPKPKTAEPRLTLDADRLRKSERDAALLVGLLPPGSDELILSEYRTASPQQGPRG